MDRYSQKLESKIRDQMALRKIRDVGHRYKWGVWSYMGVQSTWRASTKMGEGTLRAGGSRSEIRHH